MAQFTTRAPKKPGLLREILRGFVQESRALLLYSLPAAGIICSFKYWGIDVALVTAFITGIFLVTVTAFEDSGALDTPFSTFITRVITALCWYHAVGLATFYVFEEYQLDKTYGYNEPLRWTFRFLDQYYDFILSVGMIRVYFNSFLTTSRHDSEGRTGPGGGSLPVKHSITNSIKMSKSVIGGFLKESRLVFLYAIPIAAILGFLNACGLDADYTVQFIYLYSYMSIISAEDKETLDQDIKHIVACLTTAIGCYQLTRSATYFIFESGTELDKGAEERHWALAQGLSGLKLYLVTAYHTAFFRICLNSVIVTTFLLARLAANYAI